MKSRQRLNVQEPTYIWAERPECSYKCFCKFQNVGFLHLNFLFLYYHFSHLHFIFYDPYTYLYILPQLIADRFFSTFLINSSCDWRLPYLYSESPRPFTRVMRYSVSIHYFSQMFGFVFEFFISTHVWLKPPKIYLSVRPTVRNFLPVSTSGKGEPIFSPPR